jgi:hypothetical protein
LFGRSPYAGSETMQKVLLFVVKVSTWVGHAFAWMIVSLTLLIS